MRKISLGMIFFLGLPAFAASQIEKELLPRWKQWLEEEVVYIIRDKERDVFLSLKSEREREAFEKAFWLQRDPTFGTAHNEYRDEHYQRLGYVERVYGKGTVKPGWNSDRGRIYIILGEPVNRQRFYETSQNLVSSELWQYQGDASSGLPPFFYVIFYQDESTGEYKLYSPSFDGPQKLVRDTYQEKLDRYGAYLLVKNVSAELAEASLGLIPGTIGDPTIQTSDLASDILLSKIQQLPQKKVENEWAEAFARLKENVTTEYSLDYVKSNDVFFIHQENKKNYLHLIIEPNRLSLEQDANKIRAPLKLNIKISDSRQNAIHQEEKDIQIEINEEDYRKIERRIVAVGDVIPLIEGDFTINFLLRNMSSKEFSSLERKVSSPLAGIVSLSPILLLYNEKKVAQTPETVPFIFNGDKLFPNTQKNFAITDDLIVFFEIYNPSIELERHSLQITIAQDGKILNNDRELIGDRRCFLKRYPLKEYKPGFYKITVSVSDDKGMVGLEEKSEFSVSPVARIPRPWNFNKVYPSQDHPYFYLIRAYQYLGAGKYDQVIQEIENLYNEKNPHREIAIVLAKAYFKKYHYSRVVKILSPLIVLKEPEILELLGMSYFQLQDYQRAIDYFEQTLAEKGEDIEIINSVGLSYLKANDKKKALGYLERSLKLDPNQSQIREIAEKLKRDIGDM